MNTPGQIVSRAIVAIMAGAAIGCSSTQSTSMGASPSQDASLTPEQMKGCQVWRSYAGNRDVNYVFDACRQQMGEAACRTCLQMR
jgi:hypothetical protein